MKKFLILLMMAGVMYAQNAKKEITIVVEAHKLPENAKVYISGNDALLGGWNPGTVQMDKVSDSIWSRKFSFDEKETIEFKFTLGSWDSEAMNADGSVPGNKYCTVAGDTTLKYVVAAWRNGERPVFGRVTGTVEYVRNMKGEGIDPRDVVIWLPPSYGRDKDKHYPVLYMHDGQNIVDPKTSSFGVDWGADETADSLIKEGKMQEIIIVGINNTKDRTAEYSYTDKGRSYMSFITETLKPFIDKNYRTLPDRDNTATMGSSMGGLISMMLAWEHTDVFSKAACLSPAFRIGELNYLPYISGFRGKKPVSIYIDNGGLGLESRLQPGVEEMVSLLKEKGYEEGRDLLVYFEPGAEHNEIAWAKRLYKPMLFLFGVPGAQSSRTLK
ncbi:MAG: alpha/beta hydrolase-fold protein [Ignavibacteriales bacterium]